jgi:phosphatidylethanolamine-binding protein (PEBP) family uncharacterized protein
MRKSFWNKAAAVALIAGMAVPAYALSVTFDWGNIPECTSGYPNTVESPEFQLSDVPEGTAKLRFALRDLDVDYDHGGGVVTYAGGEKVPGGAFTYKSPCPPNGPHIYEWTITALDSDGRVIGKTTAQKRYP